MRVLGIETSCDETGVAVYDSEQGLLADALYSQIEIHAEYGGVVPELASRDHVRKTLPLIKKVMAEAKCSPSDIDGIAYTAGIGFFAATRLRYSHFIWHLFVIAGTACHFIAVLKFVS